VDLLDDGIGRLVQAHRGETGLMRCSRLLVNWTNQEKKWRQVLGEKWIANLLEDLDRASTMMPTLGGTDT